MQLQKWSVSSLAVVCVILVGGCGQGSGKNVKIPGVEGPKVNFIEDQMLLSVALTEAKIDFGARFPFPKMEKSFIEVGPDLQTGGYLIQVGVSLSDLALVLKNEVQSMVPRALPGGRPLPGVIEGELPALALSVPRLNHMVFYVGEAVFGFFIPVQFPIQMKGFMATHRFYDVEGTSIGNLSVVGGDTQNQNGGILVLIRIQGKVSNAMSQTQALL